MKGFGIYVKNDLLDGKHLKNMGPAVWLYMWYLDKITAVNDNGIGKVLGGQPITFEMVSSELGMERHTYVRWVERLRKAGYINTLRTPIGIVVTVNKTSKLFGNKGSAKNVTSYREKTDVTKKEHRHSDVPKMLSDVPKSNIQYKTISTNVDITKTVQVLAKANTAQAPKFFDDGSVDLRNQDIQTLVEEFESSMNLKMTRQAEQRRYAKHLLADKSVENVVKAIKFYAVARAEYSGIPQALDLKDFYFKWNAIKAFFEDISKTKKPRFKRGGGLAVA